MDHLSMEDVQTLDLKQMECNVVNLPDGSQSRYQPSFIEIERGQSFLVNYACSIITKINSLIIMTMIITGVTCSRPTNSILFGGNVPTFTGLDGNMWASQLLTIEAPDNSVKFTFYFTDIATRIYWI